MNTNTNLTANSMIESLSSLYKGIQELNHTVVSDEGIPPSVKVQFVIEMKAVMMKYSRVQDSLESVMELIDTK